MTHRNLLPLIAGMQPLEVAIQSRIFKFVKSLEESENELVNYIVKYAATASGSILGRNIRILSFRLNKTYREMLDLSSAKVKELLLERWRRETYEEYFIRADVIKELLLVKENLLTIDFGSHKVMDIVSCDFIINNLCVH